MYSGAGFWGSSTLFPVSLRVFLSGGPGAGRVTFSAGLRPTPLRFLLSEDPGAGRVTFSVAHTEAGKNLWNSISTPFP